MVMFPKLPEPERGLSIRNSKNIWEIAGSSEIGRWAFLLIRRWSIEDHQMFFEFLHTFRKAEELHYALVTLNVGRPCSRHARRDVLISLDKEQGDTEEEHLLLLSFRGRGWHHFVGDLMAYSLMGGENMNRFSPNGLSLLEPE